MLLGLERKLAVLPATGLSPSGVQHSTASPSQTKPSSLLSHDPVLNHGLDYSRFTRRYWGNRFRFLFLRLLRCFSSPGCLLSAYEFSRQFRRLTYSGISGSVPIFGSPKHFVVYHALLRLWVPRYPPQAFCRLNLVVECCAISTCYYMRCGDFINVHRGLNRFRVEVHR